MSGTSKPMVAASKPAQCVAQLAIRHAAKILIKDVPTFGPHWPDKAPLSGP